MQSGDVSSTHDEGGKDSGCCISTSQEEKNEE